MNISSVFEAQSPPYLLACSAATTAQQEPPASANGDNAEDEWRNPSNVRLFDSPLAKLFGKTSAVPVPSDKRKATEVRRAEGGDQGDEGEPAEDE